VSEARDHEDYDEQPDQPFGLMDRLFVGMFPVHFIYLALVPCWWVMAPASLGWAALGLLVCRHPAARRNAVILCGIAAAQLAMIGLIFFRMVIGYAR
jgi:hypothetical protein